MEMEEGLNKRTRPSSVKSVEIKLHNESGVVAEYSSLGLGEGVTPEVLKSELSEIGFKLDDEEVINIPLDRLYSAELLAEIEKNSTSEMIENRRNRTFNTIRNIFRDTKNKKIRWRNRSI